MTDLPPGWEWTTLEELASPEPRSITDGPFGSNLKSSHYTASGARVFRLQNIGDGVFRDEKAYISLEHFEQLRAHEAREGDLLFASLGESPPRACLVPRLNEPAIVKADCIRIRLSPHVDPQWVLYTLLSPITKRHAGALIKGVGRPRLGLHQIRSIPIPLPPLNEQRRIVAALEGHLSKVDSACTTLNNALIRTSTLQEAALRSLVSSVETKTFTLSQVLREKPINGRSVPTRDDGFPVLRLTALRNGSIDLNERKNGDWSAAKAQPFLVERDDFLVSRGNGTLALVGRGGLVNQTPDPVAFPDTLIRLRPDKSLLLSTYLAATWNSSAVRAQIESSARTTAGIYKINQSILRSIELELPSIQDQQRIVDTMSDIAVTTQRTLEAVGAARKQAALLRSTLLADAFTGQLVQQDPDDEPASFLLEQINAERAAQSKPKRTRKTKPVQETLL
ncbi:restriction endonuclease subunit S [Amycolatopsis keratiniphila]|uniref:restriction endonuclease subunit S n=1 Tax=Amycolatopsis keratiniphila TaxID=129921 RepID=UPI0033E5C4B4